MSEYEQRERRFNESLPGLFGQYAKALVFADAEGKMAYLEFVKGILAEPNLTVEQKITLIKRKAVEIGISLPAASVVDMSPFGIKEARLKMSMTVNASQSFAETKDKDLAVDSQTEVTGGWGPVKFKQHIGIKSRQSVHSEKKRSSDYSATTDAEMLMERQPVPETLQKVMDMFSSVADRTMELNLKIIERQLENVAEETADITEAAEYDPATDGGEPLAEAA